MTSIETHYTEFRAWFEAELELCTDPDERVALAEAVYLCNRQIAAARARVAARQGVPA